MRIFLGFLLALSISLACNQPYEEVRGYKIGCPLKDKSNLKVVRSMDGFDAIFYVKNIMGFFDTVMIAEIDGNVEWLSFSIDKDRKFTQLDVDRFLSSLGRRWGELTEEHDAHMFRPNNDIIDRVYFIYSTPEDKKTPEEKRQSRMLPNYEENIFKVIYKSKKFDALERKG